MHTKIRIAVEKAIARMDDATISRLKKRSSFSGIEDLIYETLMNEFHPTDSCEIKGCDRCFRLLLKEQDSFAVGVIMTGGSRYVGSYNQRRLQEVIKDKGLV